MPASLKHLSNKKLNITSLLARWKDGLYYSAAIVKCDKLNKQCLVCFEDGSEVWIKNRDLHLQLTLDQLNEEEDIVCCICDDGNSEPPNLIILCDVCQQGYHQRCHDPPVDSSKIDESEEVKDHKDWFCTTCSYILNQSDGPQSDSSATETPKQKPKQPPEIIEESQSPPVRSKPRHNSPQPQSSTPSHDQKQSSPKSKEASQQSQPSHQPTPVNTQKIISDSNSNSSSASPEQKNSKTNSIGPVKQTINPVQRVTPYYPLSNQVRLAAASSSSAALASLTASSALTVGSSSGRTKQDLVQQSNKSVQKQQQQQQQPQQIHHQQHQHQQQPQQQQQQLNLQQQHNQRAQSAGQPCLTPPAKHAVRKSSVNFVPQDQRQSAIPSAIRSVPSMASPSKSPSVTASPNASVRVSQSASSTNSVKFNHNTHPVSRLVTVSPQTPKLTPLVTSQTPPTLKQAYRPPYLPGSSGLPMSNETAAIVGASPIQPAATLSPWTISPQASIPLISQSPLVSNISKPTNETSVAFLLNLNKIITANNDHMKQGSNSNSVSNSSSNALNLPVVSPESNKNTATVGTNSPQQQKPSIVMMKLNTGTERNGLK